MMEARSRFVWQLGNASRPMTPGEANGTREQGACVSGTGAGIGKVRGADSRRWC